MCALSGARSIRNDAVRRRRRDDIIYGAAAASADAVVAQCAHFAVAGSEDFGRVECGEVTRVDTACIEREIPPTRDSHHPLAKKGRAPKSAYSTHVCVCVSLCASKLPIFRAVCV